MLYPEAVEPPAVPAVQLSYRGGGITGCDPGNETSLLRCDCGRVRSLGHRHCQSPQQVYTTSAGQTVHACPGILLTSMSPLKPSCGESCVTCLGLRLCLPGLYLYTMDNSSFRHRLMLDTCGQLRPFQEFLPISEPSELRPSYIRP